MRTKNSDGSEEIKLAPPDFSRERDSELLDLPTGSSGIGYHEIAPFVEGCAKAYQFKRVRGISEYRGLTPIYFTVGTLMHAARSQWLFDKRMGDKWRKQIQVHAKKLAAEGEKIAPTAVADATRNFEGYVEFWLNPHRPKTAVLAVEYLMEPRGFSPESQAKGGMFHRSARLDSIERRLGQTWIGESKSTYAGGGATRVAETYGLHGQVMLQISLWGPEEEQKFGKLAGVLLDPMIKGNKKGGATGADRIEVGIEQISHALKWFRKDMLRWIQQTSVIDWNTDVERRTGLCRTCEYRTLCTKGRDGSTGYVFKNGKPIAAWKPSKGKETPPWE